MSDLYAQGLQAARQGNLLEAARLIYLALQENPDMFEAHSSLGAVLAALGHHAEAVEACTRALDIQPDYLKAHYNLGNSLCALDRCEEAVQHYQEVIGAQPTMMEAWHNCGNAYLALGRVAEALDCHARSIEMQPNPAIGWNSLGITLDGMDLHSAAADCYRKAVQLAPDYADALQNLGFCLQSQQRFEEAVEAYERAAAARPLAATYNLLGLARTTLGRLGPAQEAFEHAIRLQPDKAEYFCNLGECKDFNAADVGALEKLAERMHSRTADDTVFLHFALGKAYADVGRHDDGFQHLLAGNALRRRELFYDEKASLQFMERIGRVFTADLVSRGRGCPSEVPIFIVGMPRSGTTLVEQILASHAAVFAAGETAEMERLMWSPEFPESAALWSAQQLHDIGARYARVVGQMAPTAERVTDKMPENFRLLGAIRMALPKARIIHVRRDPIDTCLSCFSKLLAANPYAFELGELGRYCRAYLDLMKHWRAVLPPDAMLEIDYEAVVADLEGQARRLLEYCGLPWDDACLRFHESRRAVRTASAAQVRRPLYRTSVGRWRPSPEQLRPLLDALQEPQ